MKSLLKILLISLVAGSTGAYIYSKFSPQIQEVIYYQSPDSSLNTLRFASDKKMTEINQDFVSASSLSTPSVVFIKTASMQQSQMSMFDWFFGGGNQRVSGSGSGVIYTHDGYIITNNHVIDKADDIEVIHNKRTYAAEVIGRDPSSDLAILKIDAEDLPAVKLGHSHKVNIGEWVLAVGNPFNLTSTVTAGIVSAKGRNINVVSSQFPIESFIQTDAAINPGNSGGALINLQGELIGINTAILSKTGSYTGYGFAVPSDIVKKVAKDLIKYGELQKAFFGANVSDLNFELVQELDLKVKTFDGVLVDVIQQSGAAQIAGLKKGDIIIKLDEVDILHKSNFDEFLACSSPGDEVKVTYIRGGKIKEGVVTLTNREGTTDILKREIFTAESLGVDLEAISKVERDKMGIEGGVRIVRVKGGLIRRLGINEGFTIISINKNPVTTPQQVEEYLSNARGRVIIEGITTNGVRGHYSYIF
ncbi:trypsin-like peptidase domain-containing protein [Cytophagaceae bacterium ABcell3]|nr:trypsin-like peptidase domain-containing protein [Cytophagaceae bacterium ABcell3]